MSFCGILCVYVCVCMLHVGLIPQATQCGKETHANQTTGRTLQADPNSRNRNKIQLTGPPASLPPLSSSCHIASLPACQLASLPAFHLATLQLLQPAHALWLSINFMASPRHTAPSLVSDCVQPLVIKISLDHAKTLPEN